MQHAIMTVFCNDFFVSRIIRTAELEFPATQPQHSQPALMAAAPCDVARSAVTIGRAGGRSWCPFCPQWPDDGSHRAYEAASLRPPAAKRHKAG